MSAVSAVIAQGRIVENRPLSQDSFLMVIDCPELPPARPGQFVKVRAWADMERGGSPFLDRPFSIHEQGNGRLSLLYRVVGPATEMMSRARVESPVKVSGPLGRGLPEGLEQSPLYLVGGGVGLAPMGMIRGAAAQLFYGERSGDLQVDEAWLKSWAGEAVATVDDGSGYGRPGLVTGPLEEALAREARPIFACGPKPMLAAVAALAARFGAPVLVSVEAGMACGFGVCLSCSLPLKSGGRFRACQEGPVVDGLSLDWERV